MVGTVSLYHLKAQLNGQQLVFLFALARENALQPLPKATKEELRKFCSDHSLEVPSAPLPLLPFEAKETWWATKINIHLEKATMQLLDVSPNTDFTFEPRAIPAIPTKPTTNSPSLPSRASRRKTNLAGLLGTGEDVQDVLAKFAEEEDELSEFYVMPRGRDSTSEEKLSPRFRGGRLTGSSSEEQEKPLVPSRPVRSSGSVPIVPPRHSSSLRMNTSTASKRFKNLAVQELITFLRPVVVEMIMYNASVALQQNNKGHTFAKVAIRNVESFDRVEYKIMDFPQKVRSVCR